MTSYEFPTQTHYISGAPYVSSEPEDTFETINPATTLPLAQVPTASPATIEACVSSSLAAFPSWSATPPAERSRILLKAVEILRKRNDELALVETKDTGKAYAETSAVDITTGADVLEYFACVAMGSGPGTGETVQLREDAWVYTTKTPLGVCAGIGAWNYPIQIALWKCAPALAAGNTFIFKSSEVTPLSALLLAEIFTQAGLPSGVFNLIHGGPTVGHALTIHPSIAKISFTGQPSTGSKVYSTSAQSLKAVTLELGGKSPFIVYADADLDLAADAALVANFFSSGQVCTNGTRVFVEESVREEFTSLVLKKVEEGVRMGDPLDPVTNFGPLVSKAHYNKVKSYITHGLEVDRASLLYPPSSLKVPTTGYFVPPHIFASCHDDMKIVREEIFGPVMCILPFSTEDEVIARANDTELGLAAGVFTRDLVKAHRTLGKVEAGICWVNTWGESPAQMGVGGWKMSGVGFENGREALGQFLRSKSVLVEQRRMEAWFVGRGKL